MVKSATALVDMYRQHFESIMSKGVNPKQMDIVRRVEAATISFDKQIDQLKELAITNGKILIQPRFGLVLISTRSLSMSV